MSIMTAFLMGICFSFQSTLRLTELTDSTSASASSVVATVDDVTSSDDAFEDTGDEARGLVIAGFSGCLPSTLLLDDEDAAGGGWRSLREVLTSEKMDLLASVKRMTLMSPRPKTGIFFRSQLLKHVYPNAFRDCMKTTSLK